MPSSSRIFFASALVGKGTEQDAAGATAPVPSLESFGSIMIFGVEARVLGAVPELDVLLKKLQATEPHRTTGALVTNNP
jgi:hypothetical protein